MNSLTAKRRAGKIVLEIDEARFLADAMQHSASRLTIADRDQFIDFALKHIFTLSHDIDADGEHPSWWRRLSEALAQAAAASGAGVREAQFAEPTCGCDPEKHDGG